MVGKFNNLPQVELPPPFKDDCRSAQSAGVQFFPSRQPSVGQHLKWCAEAGYDHVDITINRDGLRIRASRQPFTEPQTGDEIDRAFPDDD
ncbi:MAG: hypothetical protein GC155_06055 [Alphaproteobacteria bacterium]|nr:hypothetical protein [Alphaproteobacteria bacterium]